MEAAWVTIAGIVLTMILALIWAWRVANWLWLRKRLLREQGNPYRLLVGDLKEIMKMQKEAKSKPMNLSDDIVPRVFSYVQQSVNKHDEQILKTSNVQAKFLFYGKI